MNNLRRDRNHYAVGVKSRIGNKPALDRCVPWVKYRTLLFARMWSFLASANGQFRWRLGSRVLR
jgi:hypothetical protein